MITEPFEYFAPTSIEDALKLLTEFPSTSRLISGGQSLVPLMNLGLSTPKQIIDLKSITKENLAYIVDDKEIRVGALTSHYDLGASDTIRKSCLILSEAAHSIGDSQVRNRGTIGGAVCHADPSADYLPMMVTLEAIFQADSPSGKRMIKSSEFFLDAFKTALRQNEILTEIRIPKLLARPNTGGAFMKFNYVEGAFAIVCVAAIVSINNPRERKCESAKVTLGGIQTAPIVLNEIEAQFVGRTIDKKFFEDAGLAAVRAIDDPLSDIHADGEYRRELGRVFTERALRLSVERCVGTI